MDWGWTNKRLKEKAGVVHTEAKAEPGNGPLSKEEVHMFLNLPICACSVAVLPLVSDAMTDRSSQLNHRYGCSPASKFTQSNLLFDIIGQLSSSGTLSEREKKKHELEERLSRLDDTIVDAVDSECIPPPGCVQLIHLTSLSEHHESFLTALRALTAVAKTMKGSFEMHVPSSPSDGW